MTFQLPLRTFPGMWLTPAMVRPETSTLSMVPRSMCHELMELQVPSPSGSSPTQQGQSVLQVQTSRSCPSSWYPMAPFAFSSRDVHLGLDVGSSEWRNPARHDVTTAQATEISGVVTTEGPGADRLTQVLGEGWTLFADAADRVLQALPDVDARLLGRGGCLARPAAEA